MTQGSTFGWTVILPPGALTEPAGGPFLMNTTNIIYVDIGSISNFSMNAAGDTNLLKLETLSF